MLLASRHSIIAEEQGAQQECSSTLSFVVWGFYFQHNPFCFSFRRGLRELHGNYSFPIL